jgi:hypothetical protein
MQGRTGGVHRRRDETDDGRPLDVTDGSDVARFAGG